MTTQHAADAARDAVALLVVHGIGSQQPGETLKVPVTEFQQEWSVNAIRGKPRHGNLRPGG